MTVITVVNDNKPFLFNSVLSEITLSAGEPALVLHPVLAVKHGKNGVSELLGEMGPRKADDGARPRRLIHVHIPRRSDAECKALAERIRGVLKQVRAAVSDWKPMLARLDQAISDFRYAPVPMAEKRRGRGYRLSRMAARRQFHLPGHSRVPLPRRRRNR